MGTRGAITFVVDGEEKTTYNHFDSYPDYLGIKLLNWVQVIVDGGLVLEDRTKSKVRALTVVNESTPPTPKEKTLLGKRAAKAGVATFGDPGVSTGTDWYSHLRETQGDPELILASGFMTDASDFLSDSLFCEWAYVIDFDERVFEVHKGFQRQPHSVGRFASREPKKYGDGDTYYPVALVASFSFDDLPDSEGLQNAAYEGEDEDDDDA